MYCDEYDRLLVLFVQTRRLLEQQWYSCADRSFRRSCLCLDLQMTEPGLIMREGCATAAVAMLDATDIVKAMDEKEYLEEQEILTIERQQAVLVHEMLQRLAEGDE